MTTIAFLGLGNMGGPMAANLVAAGNTVHGFDPVPAAVAAAIEKGATVFGTGAEAVADADTVITMLPNGDLVKRCYAEILPAAKPGTLFIDSSTISVDDAREVNRLAADHGFAQLDAPVSGGVKGAVAGTLAFMVGGDEGAVERELVTYIAPFVAMLPSPYREALTLTELEGMTQKDAAAMLGMASRHAFSVSFWPASRK